MLSHADEDVRRSPRWLMPSLLCGIAVLGATALKLQFDRSVAAVGSDLEIAVAGPDRANTRGGIVPAPAADLVIKRLGGDGQGSIGSLETGDLWVDPQSSGLPWSALGATEGLLTFRGNPTRTYHGQGPVPTRPEIEWSVEIGCSNSSVGGQAKQWCGTGWTGQPAIFPAPAPASVSSGRQAAEPSWWVGIGGYNQSVNFFDVDDGDEAYPAFKTGDIIKGSITVDPDGYPLVYTGSRDNFFHIFAIDGREPEELWRLSSASDDPTLWNNDWDSSAMVIDDHLFVGGENSRFYVVKLNRGFDATGAVAVAPEVIFSAAGWDQELLAALGDRQVSIENSVAISGHTVYFTNSGGLVQGWDISELEQGRPPERTFRYWTGDDTDASVVIDGDGMLYVASEFERGNSRARQLGQVFKLDPTEPDDPVVWSAFAEAGIDTGVWATPALHRDLLIVPTDDGRVLALDRESGELRWTLDLPGPLWSSPVVVDETLIQGDCNGVLHAFDLSDTDRPPPRLWRLRLGGCIESTPAVWDGQIFVGTRDGRFYGIGDRN
ncbi:MAG: PQQ-binding-like beta-propeller repeat protein [Acidimicrobiales bacterium]